MSDESTALQIHAAQFSLVPQNLGQAMELAKLIADSDLAPKDYRGKAGNVLIAVQMGQEVGLSPMTAIQSIAVINGKPGLYGDVGKAILLKNGFVIEEDDVEVIRKTGAGRCRITRPGHPPCERTFSKEAAKVAGLLGKSGPWTTYPERQMAWRAFWFAARDIAADVLKGLKGREELMDYPELDVTPMGAPLGLEQKKEVTVEYYPEDRFNKGLAGVENLIKTGKRTNAEVIAFLETRFKLTDDQRKRVEAFTKDDSPEITFAQVADELEKSASIEILDLAADFIKEVKDEAQRKQLTDLYNERKEGFAQ